MELAGQLVTDSAQEMTVETNVVKTVDVPKALVDSTGDETAGVVSTELEATAEDEVDSTTEVEAIELLAYEVEAMRVLEAMELEAITELLVVSTANVELVLATDVDLTTDVVVAADEAGVVALVVAFVVEALVVVEW